MLTAALYRVVTTICFLTLLPGALAFSQSSDMVWYEETTMWADPATTATTLQNAAGGVPAEHFLARLSGAEEVPERETRARGMTTLETLTDVTGAVSSLAYTLIVANIHNVVAAHIHIGPAGTNGPVVAFLYGSVPPGSGRIQGPIANGSITQDKLVGPLAGQPLSVLIDHLKAGTAYVNVHTNDGVPPSNAGPGDFPGGEIRGQIHVPGR